MQLPEPIHKDNMTNKPITRRQLLASLSAAGVLLAAGTGFSGRAQAATTIPTAATSPWFNVKDYGAQGADRYDQDDAPFIQSAINAAAITGGTVYMPAGKYMIRSGLFIRSKVHFLGAGAEATIIKAAMPNLQMVLFPAQVKTASVEGITFEGIGSASGVKSSLVERGVQTTESSFIHINRCLFKNIANGVQLTRSEHVTVTDCSFMSILAADSLYEGYGIYVEGGANHSIQGNHFKSVPRPCIQLSAGTAYSLISGNVMEACRDAAVLLSSKLTSCTHNVIEGNLISANGLSDQENSCTYGIRLKDNCSYNSVANNSVTRSAYAGIQLDAEENGGDDRPYGNAVTGNLVDISVRGIAVLNGHANTIKANDARRVETGILLDTIGEGSSSSAKDNIVTGNSLFQCSSAAVKIGSVRCQSNTAFGNAGSDNAAGMTDNGTGTVTAGF